LGNTYEYLARRRLHQLGCVCDDDVNGYLAGVTPRSQTRITDYTVLATDNGTRFYADTANATFTLPAIRAGLSFEFMRVSDHNLVVTSAEGDNIIVVGRMETDEYTKKDGTKGKFTSLVADEVGASCRWNSWVKDQTGQTMAKVGTIGKPMPVLADEEPF
jgi:hypothetical protein